MPIGYHVSSTKASIGDAIREAADRLESFDFVDRCVQIFVTRPRKFTEILTDYDIRACRNIVHERSLTLVIHGSYLDRPWDRDTASINNIRHEMKIAASLGATGVVVHMGARVEENMQYVIGELAKDHSDVILWLEINATTPDAAFETPDKLTRLFDHISKCIASVPDCSLRVGLCIDTAHLFSCGFSMRDYDATAAWLDELPPIPIMIHLNDSDSVLGSGRDIHAAITKGNIWGEFDPDDATALPIEESGLMAILEWADVGKHTLILERRDCDILHDLMIVYNLGYFRSA